MVKSSCVQLCLGLMLAVFPSALMAQSVSEGRVEGAQDLAAFQENEDIFGEVSDQVDGEDIVVDMTAVSGEDMDGISDEMVDAGPTVLVNKITVTGVESINFEKVLALVLDYEGRELTMQQLHMLAEEITDLYAEKGYATSIAYVPVQDTDNGEVEIIVVEGRVGNIIVVGNDRFQERIFSVDIAHRLQGKVLHYPVLKSIARELSSHPDRSVSVSLKPGEEVNTSDVVVQVEEENLSHLSAGYNQAGTDLTGRDRYSLGWRRSNLLGFDDQWLVNTTYGSGLFGVSGMYLVPVFDHRTKLGYVTSFSKTDIGGAYGQFGIEAKSKSNSLFLQHQIYSADKMDILGRMGLRVTDSEVRANNAVTTNDDLSVMFTEFDFAHRGVKDRLLVSVGVDLGIPDFLGSQDDVNPNFSRTNAQAGFEKYRGSFDYSYKLPWDYTFMRAKGRAQQTTENLASSEQISLTGFNAVRGFEEGSFLADVGGVVSMEVYTPLPLFKDLRLPFSDRKLKESVQVLGFFDYARGRVNEISLNENYMEEYKSVGVGLRMKLYKDMFARVEWGFPIHEADRDFNDSKFHFAIQTELF